MSRRTVAGVLEAAALVLLVAVLAGLYLFRTPTAPPVVTGDPAVTVEPTITDRSTDPTPNGPPLVGLLQAALPSSARDVAAGANTVVASARWSDLQPAPGPISRPVVSALRAQLAGWHSAGLKVVLSPGLQYPPAWVFALPGGTRFVEQHGIEYHGTGGGSDVPDAVWNTAVRAAQADFLALLGAAVADQPLAAVRAGGLLYGELRYPGAGVGTNSFWAFSPGARRSAPHPEFVPGLDHDAAAAGAFLRWYLGSLIDYERFVVDTTRTAFGDRPVHLLLPGWGLRPGDTTEATGTLLSAKSAAEQDGRLNQGQDWAGQVRALPAGSVAYLTNLSSRGRGPAVADWAPIAYLATLAASAGIPVGGENAGAAGPEDLTWTVDVALRYRLVAVFWMNEADVFSGKPDRPSAADFAVAASALKAGDE